LNVPVATYRVQLNADFNFDNLKQIVPYLNQLGISHIYASPIFQAKKGSGHGYDIVDPNQISSDLGGQAAFESLMGEVSAYGLKWMQDIVPNHQSYSLENKMIYDLLQNGITSQYNAYFDVDWNHPSKKLKNKILAPFLTEPYIESMKKRRFCLKNEDGVKIKYLNMAFPVNKQASIRTREEIDRVNNDVTLLDKLLSEQYYSLVYWLLALKEINYRRFFDIIDLIGIRVENPSVLENTHRLVFKLTSSNQFSALRLDHIDGLYDPEQYLQKIRENLPDAFILVEKILMGNEQLPASWPIQGSTGYDFLNVTNKLFIQRGSEKQIDGFYQGFSGNYKEFSDLIYECKKLVINKYFLGDAKNLSRLINHSLAKVGYGKVSTQAMCQAVVELLACFQVYRGYVAAGKPIFEQFTKAINQAKNKKPDLIKELSLLSVLADKSGTSQQALHAIMRLQQFTGAIMAKGLEDTVFYRYNRFISANEVGGSPARLGCSKEEFHDFILERQRNWRFSLNATSSHDTKRGEDVRARLNVISEIPDEFARSLMKWAKINLDSKQRVNGKLSPNRNEEYYLYQTLIGSYPWIEEEKMDFAQRLKLHMIKALREAKENSDWINPNKQYESSVEAFIEHILKDQNFMERFLQLQRKVSFFGFLNSLSQVLIKMTCPGVPDFYQGTEFWDLNMVDPDNRRSVNYQIRQKALTEIKLLDTQETSSLCESPGNAKAKIYLIYKTLGFRQKTKPLFDEGAYIPIVIKGAHKDCIIAFMRKKNGLSAIVVATRFLTHVIAPDANWKRADWADTILIIPNSEPSNFNNLLTGKEIKTQNGRLFIKDILAGFPVALLFGVNRE